MIAIGESVTIPAGRIAVLPNVQVDGTLTIESGGDVFIPTGSTMSQVIPRVTSTDNAIVRFEGTTGAVQNSAVTIDDSGNIGGGTQSFNGFGGSGFKNYIINGNFDVWQRGTSFSAVGYCADRWCLAIGGSANATKHNVIPNTVLMTTTAASSFANLYQAIETATVIGLRGKTLTLSLKLQTGGTHTGGFVLSARYSNSTDTLNSQTTNIQSLGVSASSTNTRYSLTFTVPADAVGLRIDIENTSVQPSGALYQVQKVQLEEGSVATPFEQRPYGLELSLCQRYYEKVDGYRCNIPIYGIGTGFLGTVKYIVAKRISPTISLGTGSHWRTMGIYSGAALSTLGVQEVTGYSFDVSGTSSGGNIAAGVAGKIQVMDGYTDNGTDGIFVSAEL